jgi:hypothetical protein
MPDLDQIEQGEQGSARPARGRFLKPPTIEALKAVERCYPGLDRVICATPLGTRSRFSSPTSTASQRR